LQSAEQSKKPTEEIHHSRAFIPVKNQRWRCCE